MTISVNLIAATSIVHEVAVPVESFGVKIAVYTFASALTKLVREPPETVISASAKLLVASDDVNVTVINESLVVSAEDITPDAPDAVIVIVGAILSYVHVKLDDWFLLP